MKLISTETSIISLENVRRVDLIISEDWHTSRGVSYVIKSYLILIRYENNEYTERIECGNNTKGETMSKEYMDTIKTILAQD